MQTKAYTDYFGDCEEVTLLSHDGGKYAKVKRENGEVLEIKTGYIYKAPFKFSQYPEIKPKRFHGNVWWELQGKNPKYYKHRKEKFNYGSKDYWRVAEDWTKHPTLKEAVLHAHKISLKTKDFVKVSNRNVDVFVQENGCVLEYCWFQPNVRGNKSRPRPKFKRTLSRMLGYKY